MSPSESLEERGGEEELPKNESDASNVESTSKREIADPTPPPDVVLLRLRGLPFGAVESDVETFFEGKTVATFICRKGGASCFFFLRLRFGALEKRRYTGSRPFF